jgi:hypothetical protein
MIVINAITRSHPAAIHIKHHSAHAGSDLSLQQSSAPLNGQAALTIRQTTTTTIPQTVSSITWPRLKRRLRKPLLTQHAHFAAQTIPLINQSRIPAPRKRIAMPPPLPIMTLTKTLRIMGAGAGIDGAEHGYLRGRPDHFAA